MNTEISPHRWNPLTARVAAEKRWENYRQETENAVVAAAAEVVGKPVVDPVQAWGEIATAVFKKAVGGNVAAAKLIAQLLDAMPAPGVTMQDNRKVEMQFNVYTFRDAAALQRYLDGLVAAGEAKFVEEYLTPQIEAQTEYPIKLEVPLPNA